MLKYIIYFSLFIIQYFTFVNFTSAQIGGSDIYNFLNVATSARSSATSGSLISVKDNDISLVVLNPSLLNKTMHNSIMFSYNSFPAGINFGDIAYSRHFEKFGEFCASMQYANYGEFIATDITGVENGKFYASDYALNIAWSRPLDSLFSIGASLKNIYSVLDIYKSYGIAVDVGATYKNDTVLFPFLDEM